MKRRPMWPWERKVLFRSMNPNAVISTTASGTTVTWRGVAMSGTKFTITPDFMDAVIASDARPNPYFPRGST